MKMRMRLAGNLSALVFAAVIAGSAGATPIEAGLDVFEDSTPDIDFTGIGTGTPITTQYLASDGVTFSGGLFGFPGDRASNFDVSLSNPGTPITIDFSTTMLRVGFDVSTQAADDLRVEVSAYSGGTLVTTGTLDFVTVGLSTRFVGIEDLDEGIDRLVVQAFPVAAGGTQRFLIDNIRLDPVPEPSAALLFPTGLLLAAHGIRRRRARA